MAQPDDRLIGLQGPAAVRIFEVSPRDGLQNEPETVPTEDKIELLRRLAASGLRDIEVTSFVRPSWIPQLSDASEVVQALPALRRAAPDVRFWALVPNIRGLERAIDAGIENICTFMSASETHNKKNVNRTRAESMAGLREVMAVARDEGMGVRAYISTVFGCPYEGPIAIEETLRLSLELLTAGADELALGDTTGMANPRQVVEIIEALTSAGIPIEKLGLHMHDTRGTALANVLAGWQAGIRTFDGSVGGLGGCPYAPGAAGNAASDDLVHMFEAMGVRTGVDLDALADTGDFLAEVLGRGLPGRFHRYHLASRSRTAQKSTA